MTLVWLLRLCKPCSRQIRLASLHIQSPRLQPHGEECAHSASDTFTSPRSITHTGLRECKMLSFLWEGHCGYKQMGTILYQKQKNRAMCVHSTEQQREQGMSNSIQKKGISIRNRTLRSPVRKRRKIGR